MPQQTNCLTFHSVDESSCILLVDLLGDRSGEVVDHRRSKYGDADESEKHRLLVDAELADCVQNDLRHLRRRNCPLSCQNHRLLKIDLQLRLP